MPARLGDHEFVPQEGLAVVAAFPVQQIVPSYAAVGEPNTIVRIYGGAETGDLVKMVPHRAECDDLALQPVGDAGYKACACAGAAASDQGGELTSGLLQIVSGVRTAGVHVVCHGFRVTAGAATLTDADYEPQRDVSFEGIVRSAAVSALSPNATYVHRDLVVRISTPYAGYVRFVRTGADAGADADDVGRRRLSEGGASADGPCADAAALSASAPGGMLGSIDGDGVREIGVRFTAQGTYMMCHAYESLLVTLAEAQEQFTLQQNLSVSVRFAIDAISPSHLLVNELTTVLVPGAAGGDFVKLVQYRPSRAAQPCQGAATSLDGGMIAADAPGQLSLRVVDATLFAQEAVYLLCHAFNYTSVRVDDDTHAVLRDDDYNPQALLNVTVSFPLRAITPLDLRRFEVRSTVRKQLSLRAPAALGNAAMPGDAVVVLPASVGMCAGAAALHKRAVCDVTDSGDVTAASTLELPIIETGDGMPGVETRLLRLPAGRQVRLPRLRRAPLPQRPLHTA